MKTSYKKAFLALTIGALMVGCTKAPGVVSPGQDNLQPGVGVVNPSTNQPSCGDGATPVPPPPPVAPLVAPLCNFLAFTANIGCYDKLFLYDDILKDNYALPGAGENINNPEYFDGGKIIFDRCGQIWVYDLVAETLCSLNDINGLGVPVHRPSASWLGDKVVFVDFCGRAYLWCCTPCISVCELAKINALGKINWIRISADGLWAVFTTCDGCLYVYDICNPSVCLIADARLVCDVGRDHNKFGGFSGGGRDYVSSGCDLAFITHPAISATGRQIAFTAVTRDECGRPETSIWRYDRVLGCLDPMPFANAALNNLIAVDPIFKCYDEENIYYEALIPGFKTTRDSGGYVKIRIDNEEMADAYMDSVTTLWCNLCDRSPWEAKAICEAVKCGSDTYRYNNRTCHISSDPFATAVAVAYQYTKECGYGGTCFKDPSHSHTILEGYRVLDYNWLTETVRTLTIVNNVHGDTETLISDPALFCCPDFKDKNGKSWDRFGQYGDNLGSCDFCGGDGRYDNGNSCDHCYGDGKNHY